MKIKEIIGVDVSKLTLDVRLHLKRESGKFDNDPKGIKALIEWSEKRSGLKKAELFFVFEHTGLYSLELAKTLTGSDIGYSMQPGLAVRRSLGITRGKDDRIDAIKLARYGYRLRDELVPYELPDIAIRELKSLSRLRSRLVRQRAGYKTSYKEQARVSHQGEDQLLLELQQCLIGQLTQHIKDAEKRMKAIINEHSTLTSLYKLISSVKGVGPETARYLIITTHGFTRFKNWRTFACYCGTAPFPNSSGTSITGKNKVSHLANKKVKALLDMCAKTALQHDVQIKEYYQKKVKEGKEKMCAVNAVRNKILARVFAVVNRQTPFVDTHKFAT